MSATQNETQNGTAGTTDSQNVADLNWKEWHRFPIGELVAKTFDDGSRIHNVKRTAELFAEFGDAVELWLGNYREGKALSRTVAVGISRLRECVTDLNGDPMWAVKGTTAWKIIYENRIAPFYASLGMSDTETAALATSVKGYIRDRNIVDAVIADRCVRTVNNLKSEPWVLDAKTGESTTVGEAVAILLGDDQAKASKFEGVTMPPKLKAAMAEEYKRQTHPKGTKKAGQRKQGFEKNPTYFGPSKSKPSGGGGGGGGGQGNTGQDTAKRHSDSLRELTREGKISTHASIVFIREQLATINELLLKAKPPKGGNIPAIVADLENIAKEATLLADYKRPGDGQKPEREAVAKAAVEIPAK